MLFLCSCEQGKYDRLHYRNRKKLEWIRKRDNFHIFQKREYYIIEVQIKLYNHHLPSLELSSHCGISLWFFLFKYNKEGMISKFQLKTRFLAPNKIETMQNHAYWFMIFAICPTAPETMEGMNVKKWRKPICS